ncbi:MAG: DUF362 domain-containing protein, partial [Gammaproteobacteria bacterium]|nr:DUF362 domain-containing protein [Gammaproteobacteria bacterium]
MSQKSKVFFVETTNGESLDSLANKVKVLYDAARVEDTISRGDMVAVKTSFGEKGNIGHLKPPLIKAAVDRVKSSGGKPFLAETNTLYVGQRSNTIDHLMLAHEHGFTIENTGAPVVIGDGLLGEHDYIVNINQELCKNAYISGVAKASNAIISIAHVTGHLATGMGATFKNVGMGMSARGGKLAQHSGVIPQIISKNCQTCKVCQTWCPAEAIEMKNYTAVIDPKKCIGCGECLAVCQFKAVKIAWDEDTANLQKKVAEYCLAVLEDKTHKAAFFNFLTHITKHCDCMDEPFKPDISDIGIVVSRDPVAVEKATIDLINEHTGKDYFKHIWPEIDYSVQLEHAHK